MLRVLSQRASLECCCRQIRLASTRKYDEKDLDASYEDLANRKVLPKLDTSQVKPAFDPDLDTTKVTTVTVLNTQHDEGLLMVNTYSEGGFRLSNGIQVVGPMALFPKTLFAWRVPNDPSKLTKEAFSLFYLLDPKLDVLVVGLGDKGSTLDPIIHRHLKEDRRLGLEVLPTDAAIAVFNYLNDERRNVAGAFLPPKKALLDDHDMHARFQMRSFERDRGYVDFN